MQVALRVTRGPLAGRTFVFQEGDTFLIGRDAEAHCRLEDDPYVSRHHLLLEIVPPRVIARDLGSRNGFLLNGLRIGGPRPLSTIAPAAAEIVLRSGDVLQVGEVVMEVTIEAEAPAAAGSVPIPAAAAGAEGESPARKEKQRDTRLLDAPPVPGYEIIRFCGGGAMGKVYVGRSLADGTLAAIKVIQPRPGKSAEESRQRLEREVQILQKLHHPNIVRLLGYGEMSPGMYLILEYLPDGGVDRLLPMRGGRLPLAEAAGIMADALAGVAYAHGQGVVHRDLKPANILVGSEGDRRIAKISDLGLAKYCQAAGMSGLTVFGDIAGSFGYMPREQIISYRYVGPAADVFSLGATFYVMLTGEMIYDLSRGASPLMMVLEGEIVPLEKRGVAVPPAVAAVISRALRIDARERYPSAVEMRDAFLAAAAADGVAIS